MQVREDDTVGWRVLLDRGKIFREGELRTLDVLVHQADYHAGLGDFGRIPAVRRQNHKVEERLLLGIQTGSCYDATLAANGCALLLRDFALSLARQNDLYDLNRIFEEERLGFRLRLSAVCPNVETVSAVAV